MQRPRARPRFSIHDARPPDQVSAVIRQHLQQSEVAIGDVLRRTAWITVPNAQRTFWSPYLDLQLADDSSGGTHVDGVLGPHPKLWYTFLMVQAMFAMASIAAAVYLFSQWSVGGNLILPALALVAMLVGGGLSYGAAYVGQGLGSNQMYDLRAFVESALRDAPAPDEN